MSDATSWPGNSDRSQMNQKSMAGQAKSQNGKMQPGWLSNQASPPASSALSRLARTAAAVSATKQKAIEDAKRTQLSVLEECTRAGREPPPYKLLELIGKGSFGRVYKAAAAAAAATAAGADTKPGLLVAIKIISIEEGDAALGPRGAATADTLSDILKEVNTIRLLTSSGARNITAAVDSLLVGQSVWVVTEYCAGGSIASLMRPTGGLAEKWIIPVLREVAEALRWVHSQNIIHRDVKCANVLVTETGHVQLGDFGVAGIMESRFDKRSTVTGTLHWMAPELFDRGVSYGVEVDIWAFGSMAYEIASGSPPNASMAIGISQFGDYLRQNCPRLEGDWFSPLLKDIVASCMVEDPSQRPCIEQVQEHPYIFNTDDRYPTTSLCQLLQKYRLWESEGGARQSLFSAGGAQGLASEQSPGLDADWDFNEVNEPAFLPLLVESDSPTQDDQNVASPPSNQQNRTPRRRKPPKSKQLEIPLENVFNPETAINYEEQSRAFYAMPFMPEPPPPPPSRAIPESQAAARESLIDLDAALGDDSSEIVIQLADLSEDTIRPLARSLLHSDDDYNRRKTQEWTFAGASALPESPDGFVCVSGGGQDTTQDIQLTITGRSTDGSLNPAIMATPPSRVSVMSLIDLDASFADEPNMGHATAEPFQSRSTSPFWSPTNSNSGIQPYSFRSMSREPSLLVDEGMGWTPPPELHPSDSISGATSPILELYESSPVALDSHRDSKHNPFLARLPPLPKPPSAEVLQGICSEQELGDELHKLISSLREHLEFTSLCLQDVGSV